MTLLLASTSPYRKRLLQRLGIPFACRAPEVDESAAAGEEPEALAARLALAKAQSVAAAEPGVWVLGSDQVASIDGKGIGKPGDHARAAGQLRASSGRRVDFYTGVALVNPAAGFERCEVAPFSVYFRQLSEREIQAYLHAERPYDCAGSFKCEGLGIALFDRTQGSDPTALEGLPLITVCRLLRAAGLRVL